MPTVYLIHFDRPYCHARHYLGFVAGGRKALAERLQRHRAGYGARLLEVVTGAGISWAVVRTWRGRRDLERKLKKRHGAGRFCPCCSPKASRAEGPSPSGSQIGRNRRIGLRQQA